MRELTEAPRPIPADIPDDSAPFTPVLEKTYLDFAISIARRKKMVAGFTLAAAVIALVVALLLPNIYTGTVSLLPPQQSQSMTMTMLGQLSPLLNMAAGKDLGLRNQNDLYIGMLRSRTVGDRVVDRFNLMARYKTKVREDARRRLESNTDIISGKDGIISISVDDQDPRLAAEMANAYVGELANLTQNLAVSDAAKRRLFFEREVNATKENLSKAEDAMKRTEERTGIIHLDSQSRVMLESLARLRAEVAAKEVQIAAMRSYATAENPDVRFAEEELAGLRAQVARLEAGGGKTSASDLAIEKVPGAGLEYMRSLREVKYQEALFEFLTKNYEAAKVDEARDASVVQVLDPATPPEHKSRPHRAAIVLVSALMAFFLVVGWVFAAEWVENARRNPEYAARVHLLKASVFGNNS